MRILVTGGAGYIGSHMAKRLLAEGHEPVVIDNLSTGHREFVRYGPLVEGDLRDESLVRDTLRQHQIEAVIHFAAMALVGESMEIPEQYFANNVGSTVSLLSAMKAQGVRKLVFSSSCAVYGNAQGALIDEAHPKQPINPYGLSKLHCEQATEAIGASFGLRSAFLRYFNVIGADESGELWEWHEPETHVVPNLIKALQAGRPFSLLGTDYDTPDGSTIRDYVDVRDLVAVHLDALHALDTQERLISNVGNGRGTSVREMIAALQVALGRDIPVEEHPRRPGDPPSLVADATHLRAWSAHAQSGFRTLQDSLKSLPLAPAQAIPVKR